MSGERLFRQTQIAWPTILPLIVVAAILVPTFMRAEVVAGPWIVAGVYGVILLLFATLTVTVSNDSVRASFGIGLVGKTVPLSDVVSFVRVRNPWIYGWGIHRFPGGTLYNASGLSAVEFKLSSGRYVRIGTADPDGLVAALRQATGKDEGGYDAASAGRRWGWQHAAALIVGTLAVALAGLSFYVGLQPPTTIVGYDSLYVSNGFYRNTIMFASMQSVTLENALPHIGLKTNGFAARDTLRGNFRVDGWGTSRLFVNLDAPPFVVIRSGDARVAVNFKEPEKTRKLYADLRSRLRQRRR